MNSIDTDILIIGGGLAGTLLAYFLAREGADVLLVEAHDLGTLASGANAGSLHAQIPHEPFMLEGEGWAERFAPVIGLMLESIDLWVELEKELGADFELALPGGLLVAETDAQMRAVVRKAEVERRHGLTVHVLGASELRNIAPYVSPSMVGAAFCPREGKINPLLVMPGIARAAESSGARMLRHAPVLDLKMDGDGFVAQVPNGLIKAKRVVNCAGANAGGIATMLGLAFDIEGHPIQVNVTEPVAPLVKHLVYSAGEKLTLKQTRSGSLLIGGGWPALRDERSGVPTVNPASLYANLGVAVSVVPQLAEIRLLRTWPAIVNGTADWRPILGEVPSVPGFFMCMFPWMGVTGGPISARIVADAVLGRKTPVRYRQFLL